MVEQARSPDVQLRQEALERLLAHYLPNLRAYLRFQMHIDPRHVDDLLQDFVADRVLMRGLLAQADPQRGKFHIFLRMAVRSFVLDTWRRQQAAKRSPDRAVGLADQIAAALAERSTTQPDLDEATHAWQVLVETVKTFREECQRDGRTDVWDIFAARFLRPAAVGAEPEQLNRLAERHRLETNAKVSNLLVTAQRRLRQVLREVMLQYVPVDGLDEAIAQLHDQLLAAGAWKAALVSLATPQDMPASISTLDIAFDPDDLRNVLYFLESGIGSEPHRLGEALEEMLETPVDELVDCTASDADMRRTTLLRDVLMGTVGADTTLRQLKEFAKYRAVAARDTLPREVCTWLYYASIVAAAVHHSQRITALGSTTLLQGIDWLLGQSWLDGTSRTLFESGRRMLILDPDWEA